MVSLSFRASRHAYHYLRFSGILLFALTGIPEAPVHRAGLISGGAESGTTSRKALIGRLVTHTQRSFAAFESHTINPIT